MACDPRNLVCVFQHIEHYFRGHKTLRNTVKTIANREILLFPKFNSMLSLKPELQGHTPGGNVSGIVYHELTRQTENEHEINEGIASESLESIYVMPTTTNSWCTRSIACRVKQPCLHVPEPFSEAFTGAMDSSGHSGHFEPFRSCSEVILASLAAIQCFKFWNGWPDWIPLHFERLWPHWIPWHFETRDVRKEIVYLDRKKYNERESALLQFWTGHFELFRSCSEAILTSPVANQCFTFSNAWP
jgi:hypothetical protein